MNAKDIIVTGASRGIGRAIGAKLAAAGHRVIAIARNESLLRELAEETGCYFISADLSDPEQIRRIAERIAEKKNGIDTLIHCAGIATVGTLDEYSLESWQEIMEINLTAPFFLTQVLLPFINKSGHILFMNSTAGLQTFPEWGAYCVSKFGLKALADTLRAELKGKSIRVTSLYPASTDTDIHNTLPYNWNRKKMLTVENVANAVVYCVEQPDNVSIKSIELENFTGTF